jgi:hypothetical protein
MGCVRTLWRETVGVEGDYNSKVGLWMGWIEGGYWGRERVWEQLERLVCHELG